MAEALGFVKTAEHPTLMIIGVVIIVCLGGLVVWAETSRKDIKFWGIECALPRAVPARYLQRITRIFHGLARVKFP
jgi:hypothetical protein